MPEAVIRKAKTEDAAAIFALYRVLEGAYAGAPLLDEAAAERRWAEAYGDSRQHILVAEAGGEVIGTLTLVVVPNLGHRGRPWAAVDNVVVSEACRGQGVGRALLAEAGRIAGSFDCYKIVLSSNLVRTEAHAFYRRLGWRQTHLGFSLELE